VFTNSKNIDLGSYALGESDPYAEFVNSCLVIFDACLARSVAPADFYLALEMHKLDYINRKSLEVLEQSALVLSEGVKQGYKTFAGYEDMRQFSKQKFLPLDNMISRSDRRGTIVYGVNDDSENEERLSLVSTFGIRSLDDHVGGIFEGDMVSLLAPSKGGKSRLATYILHNAVVKHGTNIVMWSVENGVKGWESLLRARHFNWFYNSALTDVSKKRVIDSDSIRKGTLDPEMRELESASWMELRTNINYGRISSIDEDFNSDTLFEVLDSAINDYGAKLICIDYLQLISSGGDSRLTKNERIGEVYKEMLQFLKKKKVGGIFPAQLKQTAVDDMNKRTPEELMNMELRSAAGESYEVIKTPDVNLALYGSIEDMASGRMKLLSVPSRNIAPFPAIDLYVDAGSCTFSSVNLD
jgi:KaiC/GvpD/RAD55 family RecA-like ATPase